MGLGLAGCGPPAAPVVEAVADTVTLRETPAWLPAGWVEDTVPSALAVENGLTTRWSPQDAAAPLLLVSRYTVAQSEALAAQAGEAGLLPWLEARVREALAAPGARVGEAKRWRREGLRQGRRLVLTGDWPEANAGRLSGAIGLGQSYSGHLLLAVALAPCLPDGSLTAEAEALVDRLLASVPVEQGVAVTVPDAPPPATPEAAADLPGEMVDRPAGP